jgi:hypothetical protein
MKITLILAVSAALALSSCDALTKASAHIGLAPPALSGIKTVIEKDTAASVLDVATNNRSALSADAAKVVDDVAAQIQASSSSKVVVAVTAAGRKALGDYLDGDSAAQDLTDAGLAALKALIYPPAASP